MNKDTVVGILGAVILVAAMVGIFYYEGTQGPAAVGAGGSGTGPFAVTWESTTSDVETSDGSTNEGEESETRVPVGADNLTRLDFVLSWTDDHGGQPVPTDPDEFTLTVRSPDGRTFDATSDSGEVTVQVSPVNPVPQVNRTGGADEAAARAGLALAYTRTNGTGEWVVVVRLNNAGDASSPAGPLPVPLPTNDPGNPWTLTVRATTYRAEVERA